MENESPYGIHRADGIAHRRSSFSVAETVEQLTEAITAAGARLFALVDHSGEAMRAQESLRDTKLLIFGNPAAGTPVMEVAPLAALDLPLKVVVWQDDAGAVWMSYLEAAWLAERHGVPADLVMVLAAAATVTNRVGGRLGE